MSVTFVCARPYNRDTASGIQRARSCDIGFRPVLPRYQTVYPNKENCIAHCHDGIDELEQKEAEDIRAQREAVRRREILHARITAEQARRRQFELNALRARQPPRPQPQQPPPRPQPQQPQQPPPRPQPQQPPPRPQPQQPPPRPQPQQQPPRPQPQQPPPRPQPQQPPPRPPPSTEDQIRLREMALAAQREREERAKAEERIRQQEFRIPTQEEIRLQEIQRQAARDALAALDRIAKAGLNQPPQQPRRNIYQPVRPQIVIHVTYCYLFLLFFFIYGIIDISFKLWTGDYGFQQITKVDENPMNEKLLMDDLQLVLNFLKGKISDHDFSQIQEILQKIKREDASVTVDIDGYDLELNERYPEYVKFKSLGNKKMIKMIEKAKEIAYEKPLLIEYFKFKKSRTKTKKSRTKTKKSRTKTKKSRTKSRKSRS